MLRLPCLPLLSSLALAVAGPLTMGCDQASEDDLAVEDLGGKEDGIARPLGSYWPAEQGALGIDVILFGDDRTFYLDRTAGPECPEPCADVRGTVRYYSSGSRRYVRLLDAGGEILDRFAYRVVDGGLELRRVDTSTWYSLAYDPNGFCAEVEDCSHQGLAAPTYASGYWMCEDRMCRWQLTQPDCVFDMYFSQPPEGVTIGEPTSIRVADVPGLTELVQAQVVAALHASVHTEVTTAEEAIVATDDDEVLRYPIAVDDGRNFVAYKYYAGDNAYGAIFPPDSAAPVALIQDGEIHECTVAP